MHDDWVAADRRYLSEASMPKLYAPQDAIGDTNDIVAITSGEKH